MTCHQALALLEDYVDSELPTHIAAELAQHLDKCSECREEYQSSIHLTRLLRQKTVPMPAEDYWANTSALILARTTELSRTVDARLSTAEEYALRRNAFVRSLVSVAASLIILFSAIAIGSEKHQLLARFGGTDTPLYVIAPEENPADSDNLIMAQNSSSEFLAKGMILLGSPGSIGRFTGPMDFLSGQ